MKYRGMCMCLLLVFGWGREVGAQSNAGNPDILGMRLGMTPEAVENALKENISSVLKTDYKGKFSKGSYVSPEILLFGSRLASEPAALGDMYYGTGEQIEVS